jgi:hypothetical protein
MLFYQVILMLMMVHFISQNYCVLLSFYASNNATDNSAEGEHGEEGNQENSPWFKL